jgi:protein arginine kinase activator
MIKCDNCQSEAHVFFTKIVENVTKKFNLCHKCAENHGVANLDDFAFAGILTENTALALSVAPVVEADSEGSCPTCGFTRADFKRSGRMGCSDCYKLLRPDLENLLHTMQKGIRHKGKPPVHEQKRAILSLQELRRLLQASVKLENFEEAARLRDAIKNFAP